MWNSSHFIVLKPCSSLMEKYVNSLKMFFLKMEVCNEMTPWLLWSWRKKASLKLWYSLSLDIFCLLWLSNKEEEEIVLFLTLLCTTDYVSIRRSNISKALLVLKLASRGTQDALSTNCPVFGDQLNGRTCHVPREGHIWYLWIPCI